MRSNRSTISTKKSVSTDKRQSRPDVNEVTLIGRIVATPTLRETSSGKPVTTVRIATNGTKGHCEFHEVVLWNQLASFACQYLTKGRQVYVSGRIQSRTWQATDGSTRRTVEIVASRLQALSKSAEAAPAA
jgi:single-strand DNA-binding protein